jgi:hypothetical protein
VATKQHASGRRTGPTKWQARDKADRQGCRGAGLAYMIRLKVVACAKLDRMEDARHYARLVLAIRPVLTIAKYTSCVQRHLTPAFDAVVVEGAQGRPAGGMTADAPPPCVPPRMPAAAVDDRRR